MGCDYYIVKNIYIYFNDTAISRECILLERNYGYFYDIDIDEEEDDYKGKYEQSIQEQLQPRMKPIILYIDHSFCNNVFEIKYKNMVETKLSKIGKTWIDIQKIMKIESRYERD